MDSWTTGTCEANGISIHYLRTGGDKPPVVLLHGLMTSGACWTPLARILEDDYDVVMPDARGHGSSSTPTQGYSYDNLAADVLGLIEALKLNAPVLIGHSMGGMTAAVAACQNPKLLRGVVLADPTFLTPELQREVYESDVAEQHRQVLSGSKEAFLADRKSRQSHRPKELIELFIQARFQTSLDAFEILKPPNPDYKDLVGAFGIPSLLVIGDSGAVVSPEVAAELSELNPCLEVVQIKDVGHAIPFDKPEYFSAVVRAFLSSLRD